MKFLLLIIKGFIIGIANIIPGVSGGTLALILGIYERLIEILSAFWKNFKENIKFIIPLAIGAVVALIGGSYLIDYSLDKFPIATTMFFIGLVLGGIPFIYKKVHKKANIVNIIIFVITITIVILISIWNKNRVADLSSLNFLEILKLFLVGAVAAATMIIPGMSGSLMMMNLGYYEGIIGAIKGLTDFSALGHNILILLPFGIGIIVGLILIARIIRFLLKRFPVQSYFAILAFVIASIVGIIIQMKVANINVVEIIIGVLLLIVGATVTFMIARYDDLKNNEKIENVESN